MKYYKVILSGVIPHKYPGDIGLNRCRLGLIISDVLGPSARTLIIGLNPPFY